MADGDEMADSKGKGTADGAAVSATPGADEISVLYLDVDDEITSVAARLRAATAERIAVVLPYGSRLATSRINFRLLTREAAARGRRIEIVAGDPSVRALAASAGLPVHGSVAAFEAGGASGAADAAAGTSFAEIGPPPDDGTETRILAIPKDADRVPIVGRGRRATAVRPALAAGIGVTIVAVVLVAGLAAFLLLPSATIALNPRSEPVGPLNLTVEARPDVTAPDSANLAIPARRFPFDLTASQAFQATGKKVSESKAAGTVTFANYDTGSPNQVPADSIVKTEQGVAFRTLERASLGRAKIEFFINIKPTFDSVPVEAVATGTAGNVSANSIVIVPPGEDASLLKVTNQQPTTGGSHDETPQVSQQDVDAALTALNVALSSQLDERIAAAAGVPSGTTLFPATKQVGATTPSVDPKSLVGKDVPQFDLGLTSTGSVVGVDPSAVQSIATDRLRARADEPSGWQLVANSVSLEVGTAGVVGDIVSFPVSASAMRIRVVDHDTLVTQVRGLGLPEARSRLAEYGDVQITLWPDWVTSVPGDASRITLTVGSPQPASSPSPAAPGRSGAPATSPSSTVPGASP
jgi:hypothetical protein